MHNSNFHQPDPHPSEEIIRALNVQLDKEELQYLHSQAIRSIYIRTLLTITNR